MTALLDPDRITSVVETDRRSRSSKRERFAALDVLTGDGAGAIYTLDVPALVIGRDPSCDVRVDGEGVSRRHARIMNCEGRILLEDLGSRNGTWVNDIRIGEPCRLIAGDRIQIGSDTVLRFAWLDRLEHEASRARFEMSLKDALTGLYNRRALDERLEQEVSFADRHGTPLAVMVIDLDHFKRINDRFGHPCGDRVLELVSCTLVANVRTEDLVARYGGEELAVVTRGIDLAGARVVAERLRDRIAGLEIVWAGERVSVTASLGLAHTACGVYRTAPAIVAAADAALYEAKRSGRDRVCVAGA